MSIIDDDKFNKIIFFKLQYRSDYGSESEHSKINVVLLFESLSEVLTRYHQVSVVTL